MDGMRRCEKRCKCLVVWTDDLPSAARTGDEKIFGETHRCKAVRVERSMVTRLLSESDHGHKHIIVLRTTTSHRE